MFIRFLLFSFHSSGGAFCTQISERQQLHDVPIASVISVPCWLGQTVRKKILPHRWVFKTIPFYNILFQMQYKGLSKRSALVIALWIRPNNHMRIMNRGMRTNTWINVSHRDTQNRDRQEMGAAGGLGLTNCWELIQNMARGNFEKSSWSIINKPEGILHF